MGGGYHWHTVGSSARNLGHYVSTIISLSSAHNKTYTRNCINSTEGCCAFSDFI
jgi:hypothetical protein